MEWINVCVFITWPASSLDIHKMQLAMVTRLIKRWKHFSRKMEQLNAALHAAINHEIDDNEQRCGSNEETTLHANHTPIKICPLHNDAAGEFNGI